MVSFSAVRIAAKAQLRRQLVVGCRLHSTSSAPKLSASQPGTRRIWGIGAVIAAGGGVYWLSSRSAGDARLEVPFVRAVASEEEIPVVSPVKVLDLESANAKLREQAQSFIFDSADGKRGRLDVVRVASNDPVEDEWSMGIGGGIEGEKTLYAGIMDGHA